MNVKFISTLELRKEDIPRGPIIALLERETGRPLSHEYRHYLQGQPVHCGEILEIYWENQWVRGRYEWTANIKDLPTFEFEDKIISLDDKSLLRWPQV